MKIDGFMNNREIVLSYNSTYLQLGRFFMKRRKEKI